LLKQFLTIWIAAATFEVYAPTAFDAALIDEVDEQEVYHAFHVISEALEATAIWALCRIGGKTGDAAASPRPINCFEDGLTLPATTARFGNG
jgi:hypothetical protein